MPRQFYSLPNPEDLGFQWEAFEEAATRLENVRRRKEEATND